MTNPSTVFITSKISAIRVGTWQAPYQVINNSLTDIVWIGTDSTVAVNIGIPLQPQASIEWGSGKTSPVELWAILDTAAAAPVPLIMGNDIGDWSPSPIKTVTITGPVTVSGTVSISGTVNVAGSVTISGGSVNIGTITGTVTITGPVSVTNVVSTQSNAQILYNQPVPTPSGGAMANVVSIPAWVRAVYLMTPNLQADCKILLRGVTSNIFYASQLHVGSPGINPEIQCIPVLGILDTALTVNISGTGIPAGGSVVIAAIPDLGIAPVQNLPGVPLKVNVPTPPNGLPYSQTVGLSSTATVIIGGIVGVVYVLWGMYVDNASGSTSTVALLDTNGTRIWAGILPNAGNGFISFYGTPMISDLGLQMTATITGNYHVTLVYALTTL